MNDIAIESIDVEINLIFLKFRLRVNRRGNTAIERELPANATKFEELMKDFDDPQLAKAKNNTMEMIS